MHVGMIATRFAGLDGVSLEAAKLALLIRTAGHDISWFAGELGAEFTPGVAQPDAHFATAENAALEARAFASDEADPTVAGEIRWRASRLKPALREFLTGVDVAYVHNVLSIPMQFPLAVALTEILTETGTRAVAHHHDFGWEKPRFARCTVPELLAHYFPPASKGISHGVINSLARSELEERTGIRAALFPNILDFEKGPEPADSRRYRAASGIDPAATLLLQPTRIIERKGIESTIRLAAGLGGDSVVAFTHAADRDERYWERLGELARRLEVSIVYSPVVAQPAAGSPSLADAFAAADLVCFPSIQEGYGNALVETLFYKRPLFVNRYAVYVADIAPTGIRAIEMDGEVTEAVISAARALLGSPDEVAAVVEHNYAVGIEHMSHTVMRNRLLPLLEGSA